MRAAGDEPRIGPNAVIQTMRALAELEDPKVVDTVRRAAALPDPLPEGMIPERWFVRLVDVIRAQLPAPHADAVLQRSGKYTADYVRAHRIPRPVQVTLQFLPQRLAVPLLLSAFSRHAWTFAGSGQFRVEGRYPGTIVLEHGPTCRSHPSTDHSGAYYEAAFEGLLRLAAPHVHVTEEACEARGATACRSRLNIGD
jgi:divinyl protochlorophyllide a 8-vinyl-reductase